MFWPTFPTGVPSCPVLPQNWFPLKLIVCSLGKAPLACQVEGIAPASWLLDRSTVVRFVRPVVQLAGRQPVRVLFWTWKVESVDDV